MREELFDYYVEVGHNLYYYKYYAISVRRLNNAYSAILLLTSATGVASLSLWEKVPMVWTIVILLSQIMQALKPLTSFSKQREALQYIVQDLDQIFNEIWETWTKVFAYKLEAEDEIEIMNKLLDWKKRERDIMIRFAPGLDFPLKKRAQKKGAEENQQYFWYRHSAQIKEDTNNESTKCVFPCNRS